MPSEIQQSAVVGNEARKFDPEAKQTRDRNRAVPAGAVRL